MSESGPVDDILRRASVIGISFAASVVLYALLIYLLVEQRGGRPWVETTSTAPFLLALGGLLLIFISGAARARVLRSALEAWQEKGRWPGPTPELARAFFQATLLCFALAETAALLGLVSAWLSRSSFYGLVLCAASLYVMIARWPRRSAFEAYVDGTYREPVQ